MVRRAFGSRPGRGILLAAPLRLLAWLIVAAGMLAVAAQARPPALAELVEVGDLSSLAPSPDGRYAVFRLDRPSLERNRHDLSWHLVDTGSGRVHDLGGAGEAIIADPGLLVAEAPVWSPDGMWIYHRALRDGEVQVWRTAADGSGSERITEEEGDVLTLEPALDGSGIVFRVGPPREAIVRAELEEYRSGILVDEHVELGQNLFRGATIRGRPATERLTGKWFARGGLLSDRPPRRRKLDFDTLAVTDAPPEAFPTPDDVAGFPQAVARSARGDVAAAVWGDGSGALTVVRAKAPGVTVSCPAAACRDERIAWVAWRPGADEVVFATAGPARVQTLRVWAVGAGRVRTVARADGVLNGGLAGNAPCAVVRAAAICVAAGPVSPPRLERIDLETGAMRLLHDPNPLLRLRRWPATERLEWRGADGRLFTGTLFLPADGGTSRLPVFINYYLCEGFMRGGLGDEWPLAAFAAHGMASVCVTATRSSTGESGVARYETALGGLKALVSLLERRGTIDADKVGMGGLSFGSEVTMWALIHSDLLAAASVGSPQFEPANYWANGVRGRDHHKVMRRVWGLGKPEETPEQWRLISPALNVDRIEAPLLLQLAEQESRYAFELYARLTNSPTPTEMYVFPDERHIKMQPVHRLSVYRRNVDWFRFWLKGEVDPDPRKAEQYRRWQALAARQEEAAQGDGERERSHSSRETSSNTRK